MASILISVDKDHVSVAPGASVEFAVSAQNLTTLLDQVAIRIDGIDPHWVQVVPPYLPVFAQGTATARVIITPPNNLAQSVAGVYPLRVIGSSQENPTESAQTSATIEVQLVGDYQMRLTGARGNNAQEIAYPLRVQNAANAPLQLRLGGSDSADALWYKFEPFQLAVPSGSEASALLTIRPKHPSSDQRAIAFNVTASGDYSVQGRGPVNAPRHQIAGQFTQIAPAALILSISPTQAEGVQNAMYELRVGNPGLVPVTVRLVGMDDEGALSFRFDPPQLNLGPQSEARVRLVAQADTAAQPGARLVTSFRVTAATTDGVALPASAEARFAQVAAAKPFPWVVVIVGALLAFVVLCGLVLLVVSQIR